MAKVGVEGTGSFGAGIARHLTALGIERVEVDRPDQVTGGARARTTTWTRSMRRRPLRGQRTSVPKSKDGTVETLPVLRATYTTAVKACRVALQILRARIISAPEELRDQVRNLTRMQLIRTCAAWRPDLTDAADAVTATQIALKSLVQRILDLGDEITMLDELITPLVTDLAPRLLERPGIGIEIAGQLLVTAGDNPAVAAQRARVRDALRRRAAARLVRADPTAPAQPRRLPAGQQRAAPRRDQRMRMDPQTKAYVAKRTALGHSKPETIRCLKRYLAREVYYLLNPRQPAPSTAPTKISTAAWRASRGRSTRRSRSPRPAPSSGDPLYCTCRIMLRQRGRGGVLLHPQARTRSRLVAHPRDGPRGRVRLPRVLQPTPPRTTSR